MYCSHVTRIYTLPPTGYLPSYAFNSREQALQGVWPVLIPVTGQMFSANKHFVFQVECILYLFCYTLLWCLHLLAQSLCPVRREAPTVRSLHHNEEWPPLMQLDKALT